MKRSRACEDLVALEAQKRNKTVGVCGSRPTLLTRTASAEEELALLLEANALATFTSHTLRVSFDEDDDMVDDVAECLRRMPRVDTRVVSLMEKEARDARDALAFKKSFKFATDDSLEMLQNSPDTTDHIFVQDCFATDDSLEMLQNSPDTTDHIFVQDCFLQRRRSTEAPVFDMSAFIHVLEPNAA